MLPAINSSKNGHLVAIASRAPERAAEQAAKHGVRTVHETYEDVLANPEVEAVYVPLPNSLHLEWTLKALEAGKHVLCEKPLALSAAEAEAMAEAAGRTGFRLMEAFMYRFHPRLVRLHEEMREPVFVHAGFGFPLRSADNFRLQADLGGGALLDVGVYTINVARWFLGEPETVSAVADRRQVDMAVAMSLGFAGGRQASLWCSFNSPEHQDLVVVSEGRTVRLSEPFTSWKDPDDPYQLMVEAFAESIVDPDRPEPLPVADSIANLRVADRVRGVLGQA